MMKQEGNAIAGIGSSKTKAFKNFLEAFFHSETVKIL